MAGVSLSGLASGFDWKSLVTQLMDAERTPETTMRTQQAQMNSKVSSLTVIKTKLGDLQTSADALNDNTVFTARTATLADGSSTWSASAAPGAATGSYQFNVTQLATKTSRSGASDAGGGISATSDVSGVTLATMNLAVPLTAGNFTVNGAKVTVALSDSLQDVFGKISTATSGAVTASYDAASDTVQMHSASEIVLGSANDTSNFLSSLHLFNNGTGDILPPKALGVVSVNAAIAQANLKQSVTAVDSTGAGSFLINGTSISYNINTDSISTILSRINASDAGVVASYDKNSDRFSLTNKTTGDTGLTVSEASGGLLDALGLGSASTLSRGQNAKFTLDGGDEMISASNTLDESVTGITGLSVTATSETAQTVTVGSDTSGARTKVDDFVSKFNAVMDYIDQQTATTTGTNGTVTTSTLSGDREVSELQRSLRAVVFNAVPGLTGSIQRLESIGIDFKSGTSDLEVKDSTKLDTALANNPDDLQKLFNSQPGGLVAQLDAFFTKATSATGSLATETDSLTGQSKDIDNQIATLERRITADQDRMTAEFVAMEQAEATINSQMQSLTNAFGGTSSSSKSS